MKLWLLGGKNLEEALDKLYGTGAPGDSTGYLYVMDGDHFHWEQGLGIMERILKIKSDAMEPKSDATDFFIQREKVNRRQEIDGYIKRGAIIVHWSPLEEVVTVTQTKPMLFQFKAEDKITTAEDLTKENLLSAVRDYIPSLGNWTHRIIVNYFG